VTDRPHAATLTFRYPDSDAAGLVAAAVSQEVGEIDGDRSAAAVSRDGAAVQVDIGADDLVALRAGLNTWSSLVEVAERSLEAVGGDR
jgi:KEOPS complex subunit Pcc1